VFQSLILTLEATGYTVSNACTLRANAYYTEEDIYENNSTYKQKTAFGRNDVLSKTIIGHYLVHTNVSFIGLPLC
jgi:hypothetical protein